MHLQKQCKSLRVPNPLLIETCRCLAWDRLSCCSNFDCSSPRVRPLRHRLQAKQQETRRTQPNLQQLLSPCQSVRWRQQQVDKTVKHIKTLDGGVGKQLRQFEKDRQKAIANQRWDTAEKVEAAAFELLDSAIDKKKEAVSRSLHKLFDMRSNYVADRIKQAPQEVHGNAQLQAALEAALAADASVRITWRGSIGWVYALAGNGVTWLLAGWYRHQGLLSQLSCGSSVLALAVLLG